jgi:cystathionine beta-synthase
MRQHGFHQAEWELGMIGDLARAIPGRPVISANGHDQLADVVRRFKEHGISQMPVLEDGAVAGILTESDVLDSLVAGRAAADTTVAEVMVRRVSTVSTSADASELTSIFARGEVAIVVDAERRPLSIITKMDLIELLASRGKPTRVAASHG